MIEAKVQVVNLRELRSGLRAADAALPRELKKAFDEIGDIIVDEAEDLMEQEFVLPAAERTGKLKDSLRSRSTQKEGRVLSGFKRVPYAGWWEFGGSSKSPRGGIRPRREAGRAMYPALVSKRDEVRAEAVKVLERFKRRI